MADTAKVTEPRNPKCNLLMLHPYARRMASKGGSPRAGDPPYPRPNDGGFDDHALRLHPLQDDHRRRRKMTMRPTQPKSAAAGSGTGLAVISTMVSGLKPPGLQVPDPGRTK